MGFQLFSWGFQASGTMILLSVSYDRLKCNTIGRRAGREALPMSQAKRERTPPSDSDRYLSWVAAWSHAVRSAGAVAVGLVDLQSARFTDLSPRAEMLL